MHNEENKHGGNTQLNSGDLCFVLDRKKKRIHVEFSHQTPNGRAYCHGVNGDEKAYRRDMDKVFLLAKGDENGNNQVVFEAIKEMKQESSNAAIEAVERLKAKKEEIAQIEKRRADKKKSFSITKRFDILESLVRLTALGHRKALIITGEGGLGKTYTVMNVLDELGLKQEIILDPTVEPTNEQIEAVEAGAASDDEIAEIEKETGETENKTVIIKLKDGAKLTTKEGFKEDEGGTIVAEGEKGDYVVIKGFSTAKGLYETLYDHREKLIIFDDCDEVLENKTAKNILKAGLDSYDRRFISWMSAGSSGRAPKQYEFFGQIIFISNLHKDKMDNAVLTRCSKVDVSMTPDEKIERMETIVASPKYMPNVDEEIKKEALQLISENRHAGTISMRTLEEVIIYRINEPTTWQMISEYSMYS